MIAMAAELDDVEFDAPRTTREEKVSPGLRALVRLMDDAIQIPGTNFRVGLDALIGVIPGFGDIAGGIMSSVVILAADRAGAPRSVIARMVGNAGIDMLFGAVPLLGDLFDAGWKANRRNLNLLERYLERPSETRRSSKLFVIGAIALIILLVAASVTVAVLLTRALFDLISR
jgi:hypothetical protein